MHSNILQLQKIMCKELRFFHIQPVGANALVLAHKAGGIHVSHAEKLGRFSISTDE
jgi:hypothetical protein